MIPSINLNNGVEIPQLGFGTFQVDRVDTMLAAFEAGYRHFDTALAYGNEAEVGKAIAESGLPRDEIFLTTKLHWTRHGHDAALAALDESLARLRTDYVDLYLIHWPAPGEDLYIETWKALESVLADGKARAIGVSNLTIAHLRRLAERTDIVPAVNQVELHPNFQQAELREYHRAHGIATEAWSPIARGGSLKDSTIARLAAKYGKSPAQVILRWQIQLGNITLIKSATPARIRENIALFDFAIDEADMLTIAGLDGDPDGAPSKTALATLAKWEPMDETITLYRPTGPEEILLVRESGYTRWPPRLPDQPIFYPVTNEQYALQIARDWNVKASGYGCVTRFQVRKAFMDRYQVHQVGGSEHTEWWIPAEELDELNANIVGLIEVIHELRAP